jgi:hypothetical protein
MSIVDDQVTGQLPGGEVVDAAGPIGDIPQDDHLRAASEANKQLSQQGRETLESLRELQGHSTCTLLLDLPDTFMHFKVVIWGKAMQDGVEGGILQDFAGYGVEGNVFWFRRLRFGGLYYGGAFRSLAAGVIATPFPVGVGF